MTDTSTRPRIALALGSGGARGYAHMGVLDEIAARGWEVVAVAGTSMGAVVGALHAVGGVEAYRAWVEPMGRREVLRWMDPAFKGAGAIRADRLMSRLDRILGSSRIEDLPIPYTAVATDLLSQTEVWFTSGPVIEAIRASIAIPTVFTPVQRDGMLLADGGILNPVPVIPLAAVRADAIIAVNLAGTTRGGNAAQPPVDSGGPLVRLPRLRLPSFHVAEPRLVGMITDRLRARGEQGDDALVEASPVEAEPGEPPLAVSTLDVIDRSLQTLQNTVQRYRLAGYPPDVMVTVPSDACGTLDFHRATEMIALGRALAREAFDAWEGAPG
ncbi:patatin-like phospholipase family protein [Demequina lignilytica]|uniref:Patatin-like phospholipase family protein n=1 Tax=Demequina lignilytica TaxID=3051663 RepID=A0AB35MFZ8_9MICO|nr:patatin-like phospholipase family protein [Demequina sp. SYSU T0a273]MDN4482678.1 patatin-like phospholipase family protein [Demequina sp. SYSU T0a273]